MRLSLKSSLYRFGVAVSAISMIMSGVPVQALADTADEDAPTVAATTASTSDDGSDESTDTQNQDPWYEDIDEMLASGEYVNGSDDDENKGEVLVTYCGDITSGEVTEDSSLIEIEEPELIYETTGAEYEKSSGNTISKAALKNAKTRLDVKDGIVTKSDVNVDVWLVISKTATTEEMLQALKEADDPCVLDASPNYKYTLDDLSESESSASSAEQRAAEAEEANASVDNDASDADAQADENDSSASQSNSSAASEGAENSANEAETGTDTDENAQSEGDASLSSTSGNTSSTSTSSGRAASTGRLGQFAPATPEDITETADATAYQWAYNGNPCYAKSLFNTLASIADSTWNTSAANSTGVIAVVDSGIDYEHPDLEASMFDMGPYLSQTGGNRYGYNAITPTEDTRDNNGHGTHVAGIIAAQTNGYGVSGVSRGAKLISVKAANSRGDLTSASAVAAYNYLKKVATALENDPSTGGLRVVNNSWTPSKDVKFKHDETFSMCVSDLSYQFGVASVFASGNSNVNLDSSSYWGTSAIVHNGGEIYVNSLDMTGARSSFSNYGATGTQVFAPGCSIMSTTLTNSLYKYGQYLPSAMKSYSTSYETFKDSKAFTVTTDNDEKELEATCSSSKGFDDEGGYMSIAGSQIQKASARSTEATTKTRIVLRIPIDPSKAEEIGEVGFAVKMNGLTVPNAWLEVSAYNGWYKNDTETVALPKDNWVSLSINLRKIYERGGSFMPRKINIYGSEDNAYIKVAICTNKEPTSFTNSSSLSIDTVGLGNAYWNYGFMSGTSMAAPLVTGMLANISYRMDQLDGSYSKLHKSVRPQKLVGIMWKATRSLSSLAGLCSTGGTVDASKIDSAISADKNTVYTGLFDMETDPDDSEYAWYTIHGSGFGSKAGQLFVNMNGDSPVVSGLTWSDTEIKYRAPRMKGYYETDTKIETENGTQGNTSTISGLDSDDDDSDDSKKDDSNKKDDTGKTDDSNKKNDDGKTNNNEDGGKTDTGGSNTDGNNSGNSNNPSSSKMTTGTAAKAAAKKSGLAITGDITIFGIGVFVIAGAALMAAGIALNHRRQSKR